MSVGESRALSDVDESLLSSLDLKGFHSRVFRDQERQSVRAIRDPSWPRIEGHDISIWPEEVEVEYPAHQDAEFPYHFRLRFVRSDLVEAVHAEEIAEGQREELFGELAEKWRQETRLSSRIERQITHPAYLSIIGLGSKALSLILRELEERPDLWFPALEAISRENPAASSENFAQTREAWLKWGRERGHIGGAI